MRRRRPERRKILADPVYNDKLVAKFVNYIMKCGKKGVAEKIFYGCLLYTSPSPRDQRGSRMPSSA